MSDQAYKLHVVERGPKTGRPVILLHGGLSTHRYWNRVSELLESKRRLLLPDLLGFGRSPKPRRASYSLEQYIACLEHTFASYDFDEPPVLAGHSMGANIALRWAAGRSDMFSGVVLSAPLFFEQTKLHQQVASLPLEGKWLSSRTLARMVTFAMGLAGLVPSRLATRFSNGRPHYVMEDVTSQSFFVFRKLLKNAYFRDDVMTELKQVKSPVRVLIGDKDLIANQATDELEELCKRNKHCELQVLSGSHQILLEHPKTVAQAIKSL